ncbi:hypothetical protein [Variovorax paradoxus]|uniref:hypothetical protein n=1 Tax=Variovorax paradoxus TaxID=34073 RepID=UPI00247AF17A
MKSDLQWMQAQVVALRDLTPTVREFELRPEAGTAGGHEPGAHLQVQVTSAQGQLQTRSYSLVGQGEQGGGADQERAAAGERSMKDA